MRTLILDGHNDALLRLALDAEQGVPTDFLGGDGRGHLDLPRARAGGYGGGFFACFSMPRDADGAAQLGDPVTGPDGSWELALPPRDPAGACADLLEQAALLLQLEAAAPERLRIVRDAATLERCLADGVLAAILHVEGAEGIDERLDLLHVLHAAGLRSLGLVWSRSNAFGHGVPFRFPSGPDTGPGLTEAGRRLVAACNELRIVVDLAHLNERGFWDVAALSDAPLVVTHSAVHALSPFSRNLTDRQLDAIGASGGVLGVNLDVISLRGDGSDDAELPLDRFADHVVHVVERIGIEHVALGSDFDGATVPGELGDAAGLPRLLDALTRRGFGTSEVEAFAHGNWLRVLRATWGS